MRKGLRSSNSTCFFHKRNVYSESVVLVFRDVYEYMMTQQKEKGKSKGGKMENSTLQKLQSAHDEYEEEATLCVFRLKSLKQGQSRSLLTQAARHHAAQVDRDLIFSSSLLFAFSDCNLKSYLRKHT